MRILILHASAGAGHQRAAEALERALSQVSPGVTVCVKDILAFTPAVFRKGYAQGYLNLVRRAPELWGYVYANSDRNSMRPHRQKMRAMFHKLNTHGFFGFFREFNPDAVICTHFMPLEIVSTMISEGRTSVPLHCVVTDFAVHSLWLVPRVDSYFVASDEARRFLERRGFHPALVTGIPVDQRFGVRGDQAAARKALGLDPGIPTVLLLSGGYGVGPTAELVGAFARAGLAAQLIVLAGRNPKLQARVQAEAAGLGDRCVVMGFVPNLHEIMDAADYVITKPGGLSTSETLAKGLPLILIDPIPGQEQRNSDYLLEQGAAVRLHEPLDAPAKVQRLLDDPDRAGRLRSQAIAISRPDAAGSIGRIVVQNLGANA